METTVEPVSDRAPALDRRGRTTEPILDAHPDGDAQRVFNRELSWLGFDERVLSLVADASLPVLERAKFLAIFSANLDEFFQVRVAGLKEQLDAGIVDPGAEGMAPAEQLAAIRAYTERLVAQADRLFWQELVPALDESGIRYSEWATLDDDDRTSLVQEFEQRVFPVLTPLAVDPAHPFPAISNLSLNLAAMIEDPVSGETRFARVKVPPILPRFVVMPDGERVLPLEQVIAAHLDRLFPGMRVVHHHTFRVTRNADLVVEEDEADDLLEAIQSELSRQRFGRVVRLELEPDMPEELVRLLQRELGVTDEDCYRSGAPLGLAGLWALYELDRPELRFPLHAPATQQHLSSGPNGPTDLFHVIREGDVLVHHPYDSFATSVQAFLEQAAADPAVLAIKQTLYRTSGEDSPVIRALLAAAGSGKQVVALVELKARFDEQRNIDWAQRLEEAGVHVVYGVMGYKTHTKVSLVAREEGGRIRRYVHVGTGNYNERTARLYEDLGLFSAAEDLGADVGELFNYLTGYSREHRYRSLLVSPVNLRPRLLELIAREAQAADGEIVLKTNALVDPEIIEALYRASQAGTRVRCVVRGVCGLRPGVPGLSEGIEVRSVIGRWLEHSRICTFGSAGRGRDYLIGSADLMPRNLDRRVEAVVVVTDPRLQEHLQQVLDALLADDVRAWTLQPDGSWHLAPEGGSLDAQHWLAWMGRRRLSEMEQGYG